MLEVPILLMTYLIKLSNKCSTWLQEKTNQKFSQEIYHANVNVNLMEENVIQIKSRITINVDVRVKNIIYVRKIIFGILLQVAAKMEHI